MSPDYSVWIDALPLLIIEVKAPNVATAVGYREAGLYAHHLNKQFKPGLNPCSLIIATNGTTLAAGHWDSEPAFELDVKAIAPGTVNLQRLKEMCGYPRLLALVTTFKQRLRPSNFIMPYTLAGGAALLNSKRPSNTFAAPLSPVLRRYFTSTQQNADPEIYKNAYIDSEEVRSYDQVLDSLMRERLIELRGALSETLSPTKRREPKLAKKARDFQETHPAGQLQLVTGGVGTGKSLFIRRYKELLQPPDQAPATHWAFIDFNTAPRDMTAAESWLCETFIASFAIENGYDAYDSANWPQVFSMDLNRRKAIYDDIFKSSPEQAAMARANDLNSFISDPRKTAFGLTRHFLGERRGTVVVVMDNVDRLGSEEQLQIFRLSLWFMDQSRAFIILNLRDDTYERFKNQPPLDTYRAGITFHISPPRFIDVVRKRLELSTKFLAENTPDKLEYSTSSGLRFTYPNSMVGEFMKEMYVEIFERQQNSSRVIQGLAGRDVRKALEIFESVLRSGHLTEESITSKVKGARAFVVGEDTILRTLMRTEYRFHSNHSGFIANVMYCDEAWARPNNFIISDILFWLYQHRKYTGELGLEGFFTVRHVADELQLRGYVDDDIFAAAGFMLRNGLVEAEHFHPDLGSKDESIKITYSGFSHLRFLLGRGEYVYGVLPTTPVFNRQLAAEIAGVLEREASDRDVSLQMKVRAVRALSIHLHDSYRALSNSFPKFGGPDTGATYLLAQVDSLVGNGRGGQARLDTANPLDLM